MSENRRWGWLIRYIEFVQLLLLL